MRKDKANDLWQAITAYANACLKSHSKSNHEGSQSVENREKAPMEIQQAEKYLIDSFQIGTGWRPEFRTGGWKLVWGRVSTQPDRPVPILISPSDSAKLLAHINEVCAISQDEALVKTMRRVQKQLQ